MNEDGKLTNGDVPANLWADIRKKYIKTTATYRELSDHFSVSYHTIARRAKGENWKGERARYNEANLRKQRAGLMRAKLESAEEDARVRTKYARYASEVATTAMERLRSLRDAGSVNTGVIVQVAATIGRCQQVEFVARGIATDVSKVTHEVFGSWNEYLAKVRAERGLADRPNPFDNSKE